MANLSNVDTFVSGSVFKFGISGTILADSVDTDNKYTFLILFNSETQKIISSSKSLSSNDIILKADNDENGALLKINAIDDKYTKNYLLDGENFIADGFALIRVEGKEETISTISGDETVVFPDLEKKYIIMLKNALSNNPVFSNGTSFKFNPSTISFGVAQNGI